MEGYLSKWTNMVNGWQYRWFILDDNSGILSYYTSKEKMLRGVRRGCVRLKGAVIGIDDQDDCSFTISVDHKTFHFQTRSAVDREDWVRALEDTIRSHSLKKPWNSLRPPASVIDFEKKLSESDSYLQILIEETKKLKERLDNMKDDEEKTKYQTIFDHANVMLDNIKHSIVLLQIAKNTGHPVNGIFRTNTNSEISEMILEKDKSIDELSQISDLNMNINMNTMSLNDDTNPLSVPEMSYSSSENEDDFFDANDFSASIENKITKKSVDVHPAETAEFENYVNQDNESTTGSYKTTAKSSFEDNTSIDYDELYENNEEDSVDTMENHGSVISHLLSQVKIGMDLTKVALPTFILERRSLLEMYADYFAHPDLFLRTVDIKDPKERFIHVVKWYLSSFHAGRKSTVAKKPYNPILGEVFRCHWNIDDNDNNNENCNTVYDNGPLPWCSKNQLVFIAEQVSHHPPVSAFYAEHYNKRITFCAHIYTKSRFLGLSVCVMNIGQGIVTLHDYDEEYVLTFPNGYGRSILTVPWIELGGSTTIECQKTGYKCDIEFITKPFYSNKKNRISATLYDTRNGKKVFMNINGEWNGIMEAKGPDNEIKFTIDVSKLPIEKKIVKPIAKQEDNESRRVWKEVTAGLKFNDIDRATRSKMIIEQKQRDEAKSRKSLNQQWENKYFIEDGDNWKYVNSLKNRL